MLNDITDAQKLKAIVHRTFEGEDGEFLLKYLEMLCCYNMPIDDPMDEGARRVFLSLLSIMKLKPQQILDGGR
jgi:hypothetical protein